MKAFSFPYVRRRDERYRGVFQQAQVREDVLVGGMQAIHYVRIELEGYRVGGYCGHLRSCGQSSPSKHRRACDSHPWNAGMLVGKRKNTVVFRYSLDLVKLFLNSNSTISDKL